MAEQAVALRPATMRTGGALAPIVPQSIEDVFRLAKMALQSGMLRPQKIGYGDSAATEDADATLARGTMIIMQGLEIGVPPMQAVQLMAMINGRITAHSEAVPGILLAKGFRIKQSWSGTPMGDDWTAHCELTRPDGAVHLSSFSVADAKKAGLWDQAPTVTKYNKTKPNDSAWFRYPKRMLWARALGFAGKDGGSDALRGIQITEEAQDMERVDQLTTPRRNASQANKSGDYKRFEQAVRACASVDDLMACVEAHKAMLATLPETHEAMANDLVTAFRERLTAATLEPVPEPLADEQGVLDMISERYSQCDSEAEALQIKSDYADLIDRMTPASKVKALAILEVAS